MRLRGLFGRSGEGVLELLDRQGQVTADGVEAFAKWAVTGDPVAAQRVRDLEHAADDARRLVLDRLLGSLGTPIDQEDLYMLSERLDAVLNVAKNIVREAQVLEWEPDDEVAAMADAAADAMGGLRQSLAHIRGGGDTAVEAANRAIKIANSIEHRYRLAIRGAAVEPISRDVLIALEMYRRTLSLGDAIHRLAHRAWFSLVKER
jgi:uncharacterized protein Yka (UPF0111/DUF47 family)